MAAGTCVATTSIHDLGEDLSLEILFKLETMEDLNSCKYISKLWNSLITKVCLPRIASNPVYSMMIFCKFEKNTQGCFSYVRSSKDHRAIEFSSEEPSLLDTASSLPFHPTPDAFRDCCNGLLLYFDSASLNYYLCNPCTHKYIAIPNSPGDLIYHQTALIFDSHYKIVNMGGLITQAKLNIFSLATRQWSAHRNFSPEVSFGGNWHPRWMFFDGSLYRLRVARYVLKINLDNPVDCREIEIPEYTHTRHRSQVGCVGVSQGVLHYACNDIYIQMKVWTLETESSGCPDKWILKYSILHNSFNDIQNVDRYQHLRDILTFHPTADKVILGNNRGLFFYDPNTTELEPICVFSCDREQHRLDIRNKVRQEPTPQYYVYPFSPNISRLEELSQAMIKTSTR